MSKPLNGIRIIDLTQYISGSMCTLLLCDYGAEVIKVEKSLMQYDTMTEEDKCARATFHRGKRSVILNLDEESDRTIFWRLCEEANAVVEDFSPGTIEKWGITFDTLRIANPSIVYTSISGYGQNGPYAEHRASDATIQAESGIMSITGSRGREPVKCGANISSYMTAMMGCIGTMIGVINAKRTGEGKRVDISMIDTTIMCLENQFAVYMRDAVVPRPMGNTYDLFAPVGLYSSKDNKEFMLSVGTDRQWKILCEALEKPEWIDDPRYITNMRRVENLQVLDRELRAEFKKYDREKLVEIFQARQCVYGNVNDFEDVVNHPQICHRKMIFQAFYPDRSTYLVPGNPIHMSGVERQTNYAVYQPETVPEIWKTEKPETIKTEDIRIRRPLENMRILDFTQFLSGPICTLLLSDFGAEVIKIENPPLGDHTRYGPYIEQNVSSHYAMRNRGKKSIVLNMKNEEHKKIFLKLVETADAVVDNYKPGTMEKFGITYEILKEINPKITFTSISGYGQTGPYASHAAFDQTIQAESGVMSITGEAGRTPVKCGASIADFSGGLAACAGTLMGLYDAQRTGNGRRIDVAMMDTLVFGLENQFSSYLRTGEIPKPRGNYIESTLPSGAYRCKDGARLMVSVYTDDQWGNFCEALKKCGWHPQKEWMSKAQRLKDYRVIEEQIKCIFLAYTSDEMKKILLEKKCICGRVNDFERVKNHPQMKYRKTFVNAIFPNGIAFQVPGNPIHISGMERPAEYSTAPLGYHTFTVLSEVIDEQTLHRLFDPVMEEVRKSEKMVYEKS